MAFIALVRLPSLKVSTLLLVGLLVYDVFWVRTLASVIVHVELCYCQMLLNVLEFEFFLDDLESIWVFLDCS